MLRKLNTSFVLVTLLCATALMAFARPGDRQLLAQLPPSDIIAAIDLQRIQADAIPAFSSLDPRLATDLNRALEDFRRETNIDPRVFEQAVIGFRYKGKNGAEQFVLLLQGRFNAAELIETGYAAARKKNAKISREERVYEGRTVFLLGSTAKQTDMRREAVTAVDGNTLAFGTFDTVQRAIDARSGRARVDDAIVNLAASSPDALFSFAGVAPEDFTTGLTVESGDKVVDMARAIRRFAGSVNTRGLDVDAKVSLYTETAAQANDIISSLNGLRLLFGSGLRLGGASGKKDAGQLKALLNRVQINANDAEVQVRLSLSESELRALLRAF